MARRFSFAALDSNQKTTQTLYLLLGGNLGGRLEYLRLARYWVHELIGTCLEASSVYQTAAWGVQDQPDFLNQVLKIQTQCNPREVLAAISRIESDLGRQPRRVWGEREMDLDILFFDDQVVDDPDLHIPHPRIQDRRFVLVPLAELVPELRHPESGLTIRELLKICPDPLDVQNFGPPEQTEPDHFQQNESGLKESKIRMHYQLVTVEGNIGAGKTTLARYFARDFSGKLILEGFEDNPFLPKFFEDFRKNAFATELYFLAERYHQLSREMQEPELFADRIIMDYLFTKSLLFAKANLDEDEFALFHKLFHIINPRLPEPELIVYVHADVDRLVRNIQQRGRDFEQGVDPAYLEKIQANYFAWFRQNPHLRIVVVDNSEADYVGNPADYLWYQQVVSRPWEPGLHFLKVGETLPLVSSLD